MWRIVVVTAVSPVGPVPFPGKENNARSRTLMSDDDPPLPHLHLAGVQVRPCLVPLFFRIWHYEKRRFFITLNLRYMYGVLNVDEIKN